MTQIKFQGVGTTVSEEYAGKAASYLKMEAVGCFGILVRSYRFT